MNTPRWLVSIIVLTALMTASIVVPASPVSADPIDGTCYGRDGFAFQHTWDEDYIYYIRVFKDGPDEDEEVDCNDTLILSASASATSDDNEVLIKVEDHVCDLIGLVLYTHGPSVTTQTCNSPPNVLRIRLDELNGPPHFWVRVHDITNSEPEALPPFDPIGPPY